MARASWTEVESTPTLLQKLPGELVGDAVFGVPPAGRKAVYLHSSHRRVPLEPRAQAPTRLVLAGRGPTLDRAGLVRRRTR